MWRRKRSGHGMHEYELDNGLTLLLIPREGLDITTGNLTYRVGSRNEGLLVTGSTHFLEHGMFKGSKKFHGKDNGMWRLEQLGAVMNANTWLDRTSYFSVIKTEYLPSAITREADRMLEPLLTAESLKKEMTVVRNEYERGCNDTLQVLSKRLFATAFFAHPYGHSTIGWLSDIEHVTHDALNEFHDTYYTPRNATYSFTGNFDPESIKQLVFDNFKDIPKGKAPPEMYTVEPAQLGQRRVSCKLPGGSLFGIGFKACHGLCRDAIVLQVMRDLLMNGPRSFGMLLKRSDRVRDLMVSWERTRDPYLFTIWCTPKYGGMESVLDAESSLISLLQNLPVVDEDHLRSVKNEIMFGWKSEMQSTQGMSSSVTEAISRGNAFDVYERFDVLESVTADDISRVSKLYFNLDRSTVVMSYPGEVQKGLIPTNNYSLSTSTYDTSPPKLSRPSNALNISFEKNSDSHHGFTFMQYTGTNKVYSRVSCSSPCSMYSVKEYVCRKILSILMSKGVHLGSGDFNESNIVSFLENNGADRSIYESRHGVEFVLSVPSEHMSVVNKSFRLMKAELETPTLERAAFDYLKDKLSSQLLGYDANVNRVCGNALYRLMFREGDPNYRHSGAEMSRACKNLEYSDVMREHKDLLEKGLVKFTVLGPSRMVRTPSLKTTPEVVEYEACDVYKRGDKEDWVFIPNKTSCTIKMGMVVPNSLSYDLVVGAGALGNGFTGRLMSYVRDTCGLTYGINAGIRRVYGASVFELTATFNPKLLKEGLAATNKVLDGWFTGDISADEVRIQKEMMIGGHDVHFDNASSLLNTLHNTMLHEGGLPSKLDEFTDNVNRVTLEGVRASIRKLDRSALKLVVVGSFEDKL